MSKRRKTGYKIDSEYFAQLDYLGAEYSAALEKIEEQTQATNMAMEHFKKLEQQLKEKRAREQGKLK